MVFTRIAIIALLLACGPGGASKTTEPATTRAPENDAPTAAEWELGEGPTSHLGNVDGVRVVIVPVRSTTDPSLANRFLLRATGTQSEYDGLVIVVERKRREKTLAFVAQLRGAPATIVYHNKDSTNWGYDGYDPASRDDETLQPVDEPVNAERLIALRTEQRGSALRAVEPVGRKAKQEWQERILREMQAKLAEDCRGFKFSVDWDSVSDEALATTSIASTCGLPIYTVDEFCKQNPQYAKSVQDSLALQCVYKNLQEEPEREWAIEKNSDGTIVFTAGRGADSLAVLNGGLDYLRKHFNAERKVLRLGKLHFVIDYTLAQASSYYGTGPVFFPGGTSRDTDPQSFSLPSGGVNANLYRRGGKWELACDLQRQALEELSVAERDAVLKNATFKSEPKWKREPYFLSRDSHGTYYYVDRYMRAFGGKRYRVFVGRRGQLKLSKLKGLVEDSEGTLFSTTSGDLRLVVNKGKRSATWIRGRNETALTPVNIYTNRALIYDELGVYYGDELGFVCD